MPGTEQREAVGTCQHCDRTHYDARELASCCRWQCSGCGSRHSSVEECNDCCYRCPSCDAVHEYEEDANDCCLYTCGDCGEQHQTERERDRCCGDISEETDPVERSDPWHEIKLDRSSGRRPRIVSVEQEISHGIDQVSSLWHHEGWGNRAEVKGDGSLADDGVEIEYSMLNLYETADSERFSDQIAAIRKLRNDGEIRTGSRAGTHIHVSAHDLDGRRVTPKGLASVYGAFCHCEGAIYRIAAAGWARHRREEASTDYAQILNKKQDFKVKDVMLMQSPHERYYGVSYSRILNAVGGCHCGAVRIGDWQDCECNGWDEATWEWRVFNSSTRPETIHAWILLAVGLTDYAIKNNCMNLPIHGYDQYANHQSLREQVDFILGFKYSKREREVLKSAIRMSPGLGHTV